MKQLGNLRGKALALWLATSAWVAAQGNMDNVKIEATKLTDNLYYLTGSGGNIGLSIGDDGALLIDDQFAPLSERITAKVKELTDKTIKFVVNTHWHGDHTGGNENFGKAGAIIVSHENVRLRLSQGQFDRTFNRNLNQAPSKALPVVTFPDAMSLHWNGEDLKVTHVPPAHTDGDSLIFFQKANVVHTGDLYVTNGYPFSDLKSGGSFEGLIQANKLLLSKIDDNTRIIPGHGSLSNKKELGEYIAMLEGIRDKVKSMIAEGKSRADVIAAKPSAAYDGARGGGFMKPDNWIGIIFDSLSKN